MTRPPAGAWYLERHAYAPELNRAEVFQPVGSLWVNLPGVTTLEEAERLLKQGGHIT